jgi:hypothetical protein
VTTGLPNKTLQQTAATVIDLPGLEVTEVAAAAELRRSALEAQMGQSASQAHQFYEAVARTRMLWTCQDEVGFPQPKTWLGQRAQPFWSSRSRVQKIIKTVPAYKDFLPYELTWDEFLAEWIPDLNADDVNVGVNWSGKRAVGYDICADDLVVNVNYYIAKLAGDA